jgi:hypothetical protein
MTSLDDECYLIDELISKRNWKPYFAWLPVTTVFGQRIWLKSCFRNTRLFVSPATNGKGLNAYYEYATAFDLLRIS